MSTTHNPKRILIQGPTPPVVRCFRHSMSMASCDDCRRVRTAQLARRRKEAEAKS